jgi:hypothetical protein
MATVDMIYNIQLQRQLGINCPRGNSKVGMLGQTMNLRFIWSLVGLRVGVCALQVEGLFSIQCFGVW